MPDDKKSKLPNLPNLLSEVSGEIAWSVKPSESDLAMCDSVRQTLLESEGSLEQFTRQLSECTVRKFSYRKLILHHRGETRQSFFKIFLPDFSFRWRRGLRIFKTPAAREVKWFDYVGALGVDVVDVLGVGILPWKKRFCVQEISFMVKASSLETGSVRAAMKNQSLSLPQRLAISREILDITEKLHGNGLGSLDMNASNVLFEPSSGKVLLCDLERMCKLPRLQKEHRICQDMRKVRRTLKLLLTATNPETEQLLGR